MSLWQCPCVCVAVLLEGSCGPKKTPTQKSCCPATISGPGVGAAGGDTCMRVCASTRVHAFVRAFTRAYVRHCMHELVHTCVSCMRAFLHTCVPVCMSACLRPCMLACVLAVLVAAATPVLQNRLPHPRLTHTTCLRVPHVSWR